MRAHTHIKRSIQRNVLPPSSGQSNNTITQIFFSHKCSQIYSYLTIHRVSKLKLSTVVISYYTLHHYLFLQFWWTHEVMQFVQMNMGFPTQSSFVHHICSFFWVITFSAPSNIISGIIQWPEDDGKVHAGFCWWGARGMEQSRCARISEVPMQSFLVKGKLVSMHNYIPCMQP
jgi:hypothetical protein